MWSGMKDIIKLVIWVELEVILMGILCHNIKEILVICICALANVITTRKKLRMVHRIVAEAFIPNPNNLPFISHKDETKTNNCADNLEWVSAKENNNMPKHKQRISAKRKQVGIKGKAHISPVWCDGILYDTLTKFSISWELNPSTVWRWLNGKTQMPQEWKDRGLKYD